jgi:hypothetical protein
MDAATVALSADGVRFADAGGGAGTVSLGVGANGSATDGGSSCVCVLMFVETTLPPAGGKFMSAGVRLSDATGDGGCGDPGRAKAAFDSALAALSPAARTQ